MRILFSAFLFIAVLAGCATQKKSTQAFLEKEAAVVQACIQPVFKMSLPTRFTVNTDTGRSPMRGATQCYADQLKNVAFMTSYQHREIVVTYADYLTRLMEQQDRGEIEQASAISIYQQAQTWFRQSIDAADAQVDKASRRAFADRLAFLGSTMAEQDRQRVNAAASSQPVTCTTHGIYAQNTMICR
jgi:hypothetical protein